MTIRASIRSPIRATSYNPASKWVTGGAPSYDADAVTYFAAIASDPGTAWKSAANTYITALKAASLWAKIDLLHLPAPTAQGFRVNAKRTTIVGTESGTVTYADKDGYTSDGTTGYIDTGYNPTTVSTPLFAQDSAFMGVWCRTNISGSVFAAGSGRARIAPRVSANMSVNANTATAKTGALPVATSVGFSSWSRTGASAIALYKDGASIATDTLVSAALTNANFFICAYNNNTSGAATPLGYTTVQVALVVAGSGLNDSEQAALYTPTAAFITAVDAI